MHLSALPRGAIFACQTKQDICKETQIQVWMVRYANSRVGWGGTRWLSLGPVLGSINCNSFGFAKELVRNFNSSAVAEIFSTV